MGLVKLHMCTYKSYICRLDAETNKWTLVVECTRWNHGAVMNKLWNYVLTTKCKKEDVVAMRNTLQQETVASADKTAQDDNECDDDDNSEAENSDYEIGGID